MLAQTLGLDERSAALGLLYGAEAAVSSAGRSATKTTKNTSAGEPKTGESAAPRAKPQQKNKPATTLPPPRDDPTLTPRELLGSTNSTTATVPYYLTTAINYANGSPHMGHAYEALFSDVIARYRRLAGFETFLLTGADEHGQKIANTAARLGVTPKALVDECVAKFKALDAKLDVSYDHYVRTTHDRHKAGCRALWLRCAKDITLERYEGWYDERAEMFVKTSDAEAQNFKDADGIPLKRTTEECYFFALGKYAEDIKAHIAAHPDFVQPAARRAEVLKMLDDAEALEKLSISRTTFDWGVALPEGFDSNHVMYVWIDALCNYLTGIGWPEGVLTEPSSGETAARTPGDCYDKFWPAEVHVIGKDIVRFHAIYWPAILRSAGLPWPKRVFCHGFVLDAAGAKMSKTLGNVLDAEVLIDKYGSDAFRYFSVKEASPGADVKFSETALIVARNAELGDAFGNLVHRATALAASKAGGRVPEIIVESSTPGSPFDLVALRETCAAAADAFDVAAYAKAVMAAARDANKWLQDAAPWTRKAAVDAERDAMLRTLLEACYVLALFVAPLAPRAATLAARRVGGVTAPGAVPTFDALDATFRTNLRDDAAVTQGAPLFAQIDLGGGGADASCGPPKKKGDVASALKAEKQRSSGASAAKAKPAKGGNNNNAKAAAAKEEVTDYGDDDDTAASRLALVVGRIVEVWPHPDSDKLFCEKIDCGAAFGGVREIGSGLRKHYERADLENRLVLVAANLKSKKLAGFPSQGMVLCASDPADGGAVVCVEPPADAQPGDRVALPGLDGNAAASDSQCDKKKLFAKAQPHFAVRGGVCHYKDKPFAIPGRAGPCTAPAPDGVPIC